MNSKPGKIVASIFVGFLMMLFAVAIASRHGFIWNMTDSVPLGVYKTTTQGNGKFLMFCPAGTSAAIANERGYRKPSSICPDGFTPLLKPISAIAGDVVTVTDRGLAVNGRALPNSMPKRIDSRGRAMPRVARGSYAVAPNTVWVISTYNPQSFDSRYFGPVTLSDAIAYVKPIVTF